MRASDAHSARVLIDSARRSAERIGVAGESDLATRLAGEIIRRARVAAALHLTGQARIVAEGIEASRHQGIMASRERHQGNKASWDQGKEPVPTPQCLDALIPRSLASIPRCHDASMHSALEIMK